MAILSVVQFWGTIDNPLYVFSCAEVIVQNAENNGNNTVVEINLT
jgi:hypothetical protein